MLQLFCAVFVSLSILCSVALRGVGYHNLHAFDMHINYILLTKAIDIDMRNIRLDIAHWAQNQPQCEFMQLNKFAE